jgi:hypothetical protein
MVPTLDGLIMSNEARVQRRRGRARANDGAVATEARVDSSDARTGHGMSATEDAAEQPDATDEARVL